MAMMSGLHIYLSRPVSWKGKNVLPFEDVVCHPRRSSSVTPRRFPAETPPSHLTSISMSSFLWCSLVFCILTVQTRAAEGLAGLECQCPGPAYNNENQRTEISGTTRQMARSEQLRG